MRFPTSGINTIDRGHIACYNMFVVSLSLGEANTHRDHLNFIKEIYYGITSGN